MKSRLPVTQKFTVATARDSRRAVQMSAVTMHRRSSEGV